MIGVEPSEVQSFRLKLALPEVSAEATVGFAGELAVKSQPAEVLPYATAIGERLVPILAAPAGSMPRSIIENRYTQHLKSAKFPEDWATRLICGPLPFPLHFPTIVHTWHRQGTCCSSLLWAAQHCGFRLMVILVQCDHAGAHCLDLS